MAQRAKSLTRAVKLQGNQNAARKGRARVSFSVSLSGARLKHFEAYLRETDNANDDERSDDQIADAAREMLDIWIDQLIVK